MTPAPMGNSKSARSRVSMFVLASGLIGGCHAPVDSTPVSIDRAIAAGTRALIAAQSPDGAWRSETYGVWKDGLALTPTVLKAVVFVTRGGGLRVSPGVAGPRLWSGPPRSTRLFPSTRPRRRRLC